MQMDLNVCMQVSDFFVCILCSIYIYIYISPVCSSKVIGEMILIEMTLYIGRTLTFLLFLFVVKLNSRQI